MKPGEVIRFVRVPRLELVSSRSGAMGWSGRDYGIIADDGYPGFWAPAVLQDILADAVSKLLGSAARAPLDHVVHIRLDERGDVTCTVEAKSDDSLGGASGARQPPKGAPRLRKARLPRVDDPARVDSRSVPEATYLEWIPSVIEGLGVGATRRIVLDKLSSEYGSRLRRGDHEHLGNGEERWKNRASWARKKLVSNGVLDVSAPRGVWRLTQDWRHRAQS